MTATAIRTRRHLHKHPIGLLMLLCVPVITPTGSIASDGTSTQTHPPALGLLANEKIIWIYQHHVQDGGLQIVRFAYQPYRGSFKGRFWGGPVVTGAVVDAALRGEDIHVIFGDGTHKRFAPLRYGPAPTVSPMRIELNLPDGALPEALTVDEDRGVVYAVVTNRVAQKIEADRKQRETWRQEFEREDDDVERPDPVGEENLRLEATRPEGTTDSNETDAEITKGAFALVRYEQGFWYVDRPGPQQLPVTHGIGAMLALKERLILASIDEAGLSARLTLWESTAAENPFQLLGEIRLAGRSAGQTISACGDDLCVAAIVDREGQRVAQVLRWSDDQWALPVALQDESGAPFPLTSSCAIAFAGEKVALAFSADDQTTNVGLWASDTGAPAVAPVTVDIIADSPTPTVAPQAQQFLHYAVLGVVVAVVFVWRRERIVSFAPLKPDQQPARLERRLLAVIIDLAILGPVWAPIVFALWRSGAPNMTVSEQLMYRQPQQASPLFWAGAAVGGVYAVYGAVLELTLGHTLGKRVVRCDVVGEGGEPCNAKAIFIRNAVRVMEWHFLPVALLVALTPSRQRLGDMLARTVVVERISGPPGVDEVIDDEPQTPNPDDPTDAPPRQLSTIRRPPRP